MTKVANETSDNGKSLRRLRGRTISLSHRTSDCKSGTASRTASTRRAGVQHLHPKNTKEQQQQNDALERPIVVDFVTAKADFVQVTRAAVSKLMEQHGFSRERAVETLSRTIARMNNSATAASIAASSSLKKEQPSCRPDLEVCSFVFPRLSHLFTVWFLFVVGRQWQLFNPPCF